MLLDGVFVEQRAGIATMAFLLISLVLTLTKLVVLDYRRYYRTDDVTHPLQDEDGNTEINPEEEKNLIDEELIAMSEDRLQKSFENRLMLAESDDNDNINNDDIDERCSMDESCEDDLISTHSEEHEHKSGFSLAPPVFDVQFKKINHQDSSHSLIQRLSLDSPARGRSAFHQPLRSRMHVNQPLSMIQAVSTATPTTLQNDMIAELEKDAIKPNISPIHLINGLRSDITQHQKNAIQSVGQTGSPFFANLTGNSPLVPIQSSTAFSHGTLHQSRTPVHNEKTSLDNQRYSSSSVSPILSTTNGFTTPQDIRMTPMAMSTPDVTSNGIQRQRNDWTNNRILFMVVTVLCIWFLVHFCLLPVLELLRLDAIIDQKRHTMGVLDQIHRPD